MFDAHDAREESCTLLVDQSAAFAAVVCLLIAATLVDPIDASQKIPTLNVSDSEPSQAVLASELLERDMPRDEAEAILRQLGFRGGIWNLNCGSAHGLYNLPESGGEAIALSFGIADAEGMRHLEHWRISSGGARFVEPPAFRRMLSFKFEDLSVPDQWLSNFTVYSESGCLPPIKVDRSVDIPLLTTR